MNECPKHGEFPEEELICPECGRLDAIEDEMDEAKNRYYESLEASCDEKIHIDCHNVRSSQSKEG